MKSDYFTVELRYPSDTQHKPVLTTDIRHSIMVDNKGVKVLVKSAVESSRRAGKYKGRPRGTVNR